MKSQKTLFIPIEEQSSDIFNEAPNYDLLTYSDILFNSKGFYGCVAVGLNLHTFYYNDTIIADHLMKTYQYEPWVVSLIQSVQPVGFLLTTHFASRIIKRFNPQLIVILAQGFQALAAFLVGPSQFFGIPEKIYIMTIGLLLTGIASPYNLITPFSILSQTVESKKNKNYNSEQVQDIISGLFNSFYAIGGISGPIFGGYVFQLTNFRTTSDIQALILIFIGLTQLLIVYLPEKLLINGTKNNQEKIAEAKIENIQTEQGLQDVH
ncbi:permeases of the major facilitator superfamily [Stylonychia lemnae]|uniref:Permeases of the major facilitator superfamily n=1 Tax=Stylonychia lemnae TaxID=5949 RepID=A0A077ZV64_STYLE|nr:permeases of the major facilitator superfamily [Stylonychia lemnae]|eukprot:CDW73779.1 permeases of the major facilitator superfamily [Stylonychia lemnae]